MRLSLNAKPHRRAGRCQQPAAQRDFGTREGALRFNRGIIGLCVAVLLAIYFIPI
jgi:hypothetical protein